MFGKKTKEIIELRLKNEQLAERIAGLEAELSTLRERESAVLKAITQANAAAERIERDAGSESDRLIASATKAVQDAAKRANDILAQADDEAATIKKDADDYSENLRLDANVFAERTIFASQQEVKKRKDVVYRLGDMLRKTSEYLDEQTAAFKTMLDSVIDDSEREANELCREVEKCACSCEDCAEPCSLHKDSSREEEAAESAEAAKSAEAAEADAAPEGLPEDYSTPAELMKSIYLIEKRDIPQEAVSPAPAELPGGEELRGAVSQIAASD